MYCLNVGAIPEERTMLSRVSIIVVESQLVTLLDICESLAFLYVAFVAVELVNSMLSLWVIVRGSCSPRFNESLEMSFSMVIVVVVVG